MSLIYITLLAIVAMAGVAAITVPCIVGLLGWEAWQAIPGEVYARRPQRAGRIRPLQLWIAYGVIACIGRIFEWMHQKSLSQLAESVSWLVLGVVLIWHLYWAVGVIRHRDELDARLVTFAKYAIVGASTALAILLIGCLTTLFSS